MKRWPFRPGSEPRPSKDSIGAPGQFSRKPGCRGVCPPGAEAPTCETLSQLFASRTTSDFMAPLRLDYSIYYCRALMTNERRASPRRGTMH